MHPLIPLDPPVRLVYHVTLAFKYVLPPGQDFAFSCICKVFYNVAHALAPSYSCIGVAWWVGGTIRGSRPYDWLAPVVPAEKN